MRLLVLAAGLAMLLALAPPPAPAATAPSHQGVWPLEPRPEVVQGFDPPRERWGAGHRGVDLRGRPGQQVRAALAGTVVFTGVVAGRGVVSVDHGPFRTTYEPVDATVAVGQPVGRGEVIGVLRRAGSHCPPATCLHWGLKQGEGYLDPLALVGAGPVRLLPLTGALPTAPAIARAPSPLAPLLVAPRARLPAHGPVRAV